MTHLREFEASADRKQQGSANRCNEIALMICDRPIDSVDFTHLDEGANELLRYTT